jgi:hypothetical protein
MSSRVAFVAAALVAGAVMFTPSVAQAAPIIGSIGFSGDWAPNGGTIATTNAVNILGDDANVEKSTPDAAGGFKVLFSSSLFRFQI